MIKTFLTLTTLALLFSCQETAPTDAINDATIEEMIEEIGDFSEDLDAEETSKKGGEQRADYKADWKRFKQAVINKDLRGISAFASSDEVDAEYLLMYMETESFLNALKSTNLDDLELQVSDAGKSYVFEAFDSETNEDGFVMETAILLYFTKGENGLEFDRFATAG